MIRICTLLFCCFIVWTTQAQRQTDHWLELNEAKIDLPADLKPAAIPEKHATTSDGKTTSPALRKDNVNSHQYLKKAEETF